MDIEMSDKDFPRPGTPHYKVVSIPWAGTPNWVQKLEDAINKYAEEGYRPILYGDSGAQNTVILEKIT
jgi:hypothetical protein